MARSRRSLRSRRAPSDICCTADRACRLHQTQGLSQASVKQLLAVALILLGACASHVVQVRTKPAPVADAPALTVANGFEQSVNVFAVKAGTDIFLGQVQPRTTETFSVL